MSDTAPSSSFDPKDFVFDISVRGRSDDKYGLFSPLRRVRVTVELRSAQEARLKEKAEREKRRQARAAQGTMDEDEDDDGDDELDDLFGDDDYVQGIARITGVIIMRHLCRDQFFSVCDEHSNELAQFSTRLFDNNGMLKPEYTQNEWHKGTGCFGKELNNGALIYLDTVEVDEQVRVYFSSLYPSSSVFVQYRNKGIGSLMLESFLHSRHVGKDDPVILWPTPIENVEMLNNAQFHKERLRIESFFHKVCNSS